MSAEGKTSYITAPPGLEGVIAGESAICSVDARSGLMYRGYNIDEIAGRTSFEEIAWLLLRGELPSGEEQRQMREELSREAELPDAVVKLLRLLAGSAAPIDLLRTAVSAVGIFDAEANDNSHDANQRKAIRLIAKVSTLVSSGWRISRGMEPVAPPPGMGLAERFLYCLNAERPADWQVRALNTMLALYAEHEFNASTFSARVTASTLADIYSAVTSAIGTLKGALHGGANEASMSMLREIKRPEDADAWVAAHLAKKEKIMGFGHRVYRTGDSRVPVARRLARELAVRFGEEQLIDTVEQLEAAMERQKGLYANVDLYAAPILHLMGIPSALDVPVFACARVAGWCAHVIEQHDHNRIIRPRSLYVG
ncbi:MAG TPA: citrate/2-methylcitrate synthase, partial [Tepidisphaeraceae bacterium]